MTTGCQRFTTTPSSSTSSQGSLHVRSTSATEDADGRWCISWLLSDAVCLSVYASIHCVYELLNMSLSPCVYLALADFSLDRCGFLFIDPCLSVYLPLFLSQAYSLSLFTVSLYPLYNAAVTALISVCLFIFFVFSYFRISYFHISYIFRIFVIFSYFRFLYKWGTRPAGWSWFREFSGHILVYTVCRDQESRYYGKHSLVGVWRRFFMRIIW